MKSATSFRLLSLLWFFLNSVSTLGAQLAFPGAEGFGASSTGGRSGQLLIVSNLNASGPGSLQWAVAQPGARFVIFSVSGVIEGDILIPHGDLTIAGESAPGDGITIAGKLWTAYDYGIDNIIVRFLRIRPRDLSGNQGDAIQFSRSQNFILDHVSVAWGSDETIDIYEAKDATIQWCTVEASATYAGHPDGDFHNYGLINGPDGGRITIHHNLFAHHRRRSPAVASGPADIRNNVIYDFRDGFVHDNPSNNSGFNIVGNTFIRGPSENDIFPVAMGDDDGQVIDYHVVDNWVIDGVDFNGVVANPWTDAAVPYGVQYYLGKGRFSSAFVEGSPSSFENPQVSYSEVIALAGCFPRDVVTRNTVSDVVNRTGSWGRVVPDNLWEGLDSGWSTPTDADEDGMPEFWEQQHGIFGTGNNAMDVNLASTAGYCNIEVYLHEQVRRKLGETSTVPSQGIAVPVEHSMPLFRLFSQNNSNPRSYFFTASSEEAIQVITNQKYSQWFYEGVSQFVMAGPVEEGLLPVYRMSTGGMFPVYLFTLDLAEKASLEAGTVWRWAQMESHSSPTTTRSRGRCLFTDSVTTVEPVFSIPPLCRRLIRCCRCLGIINGS